MSSSETHPPGCRPCRFPEQEPRVAAAIRVCQQLHKNGHKALFAGGCVRDFLLNRPILDIDIATSAYPEDVQTLFPESLAVGKAFGVILVPQDSFRFEVATFRIDSETSDGRRPDSVVFANAEADAFRRDFTVNALFYDPKEHQVLDFTGGLADLDAQLLKTVGPPAERFQEDYLRMLRAIRFTHTLGFTLDPEARDTIIREAGLITQLPVERIHQELETLFNGTQVPGKALEDLIDTGIWAFILKPLLPKNFSPHSKFLSIPASIRSAIDTAAPVEYWEVLTLYAHWTDLSAEWFTVQAIQKMGFSRAHASKSVELLQSLHPLNDLQNLDNYQLCVLANREIFPNLLNILRAGMQIRSQTKDLEPLDAFEQRAHFYIPSPAPWITGEDLIRANIPEGPDRGRLLDTAFRMQLNGDLADRSHALEWLGQEAKPRP